MGVRPWFWGPLLLTGAFINLLEVPGVPESHGGGRTKVAGGGVGREGLGEELGPVPRGGSQKASDPREVWGEQGWAEARAEAAEHCPCEDPGLKERLLETGEAGQLVRE